MNDDPGVAYEEANERFESPLASLGDGIRAAGHPGHHAPAPRNAFAELTAEGELKVSPRNVAWENYLAVTDVIDGRTPRERLAEVFG